MRINLKEYGILPGCDDLNTKLNAVIDKVQGDEVVELVFDKGEYNFCEEKSYQKIIYMTNTAGYNEMKKPLKKVGVYLENRKNIVLNGKGSTLMYSGRMTQFCLINCVNVEITNFVLDFDRASVVEFTVEKIKGNSVTVRPCQDSLYCVQRGKFLLEGLEHVDARVVVQECDVKAQLTKRIDVMSWHGNCMDKQKDAVDNGDGTVTFTLKKHKFKQGMVYQLCKILRDGCGTFIEECKDIKLTNNWYKFMHGMGILAQLSENITISDCKFLPNRDKGRTTVAFADMIHCSMCAGDIIVKNSQFDGSRDDIINVHGNHWIIKKAEGNKLVLQYGHSQTYGFLGVRAGDTIEFINSGNLTPMSQAKVVQSKLIDPSSIEVELDKAVEIDKKTTVADNYSMSPNLYVDNIQAYNIPTRGLLITTKGKVVVKNSLFHKMYMSAILFSDDALNWYESSYVRDITIENNKFVDCCDWIIDVFPEAHNKKDKPIVHKNIRVLNNEIQLSCDKLLRLKRCENFVFKGNTVTGVKKPKVEIVDCVNVVVDDIK